MSRIDAVLDRLGELGRTDEALEQLRRRVAELEEVRERLVADKLQLAAVVAGSGEVSGDGGADALAALRARLDEREVALAASKRAAAEADERLVAREAAQALSRERQIAGERRIAQLESERAALETALMTARDRAVLNGEGRGRAPEDESRSQELEVAVAAAREAARQAQGEARQAQGEARQAQEDLISAVAALDEMETRAERAERARAEAKRGERSAVEDLDELDPGERVRLKLEIEDLRRRLKGEGVPERIRQLELELAAERRMRTALEARFPELRAQAAEGAAAAEQALQLGVRVRELEARVAELLEEGRRGPRRQQTLDLAAPLSEAAARQHNHSARVGGSAATLEFTAVAYEATRPLAEWDET